jgi:hypothetical protein
VRRGSGVAGLACALVLIASAQAAQTAANVQAKIALGPTPRTAVLYANGATTEVSKLKFGAGVTVVTLGPDQATVRVRFVLPAGLRWGLDEPDPTENCSSTDTEADCRPPGPLVPGDNQRESAGWGWDIVADAPGTYVLRAEIVESSTSDPDLSDNVATLNVVVSRPQVVASAVRVVPAKPKAGAVVTARVRVSAGGEDVTPTAVACSATIGPTKITGKRGSAPGAALCRFRPPASAHGKRMRGAVAFTAEGNRVTRRFSAVLR